MKYIKINLRINWKFASLRSIVVRIFQLTKCFEQSLQWTFLYTNRLKRTMILFAQRHIYSEMHFV